MLKQRKWREDVNEELEQENGDTTQAPSAGSRDLGMRRGARAAAGCKYEYSLSSASVVNLSSLEYYFIPGRP